MHRSCKRLLAAFLLFSLHLTAEIRSLTILHTNDLHARLSPLENGQGGFAYLAAVIRKERENCTDCILLNAGDLVQGTPVSTIFKGLPVYELGNLFGFDAATLGNHEFDYGWERTRDFIAHANYPIVSANIAGNGGSLITPKPYVILNVNHLRVAVIGGETEDLHNLSTPKLLGPYHTLPLVETVRKYAAELRKKSDLVVLVAHITGEEEKAILDNVPDVQVTISGHIHKGMEQPLLKDGRLVVRVKSYGVELGRLDLNIDTETKAPVQWKWSRLLVDSTKIAPAPDMARAVKHWEDEVASKVDKPLAVSEQRLDEHQVKQLIEKAMREETGADFAFMNQGGVRDILPEGQLLERHIWNIMPFDNDVVIGTFKGSQLPAAVLGNDKVDPDREYTLAVTDFTAANQGSSENLRTTGLVFPRDQGLLRDMLIDWFRKKKVVGP